MAWAMCSVDLATRDVEHLASSFAAFETAYRATAGLVPEWSDRFPGEPVAERSGCGVLAGPATPGEKLVVALGDSCTFGKGVVEADTWPRQLEAMLRERLGPGVRPLVFNLGVNGYSMWQYERVLEQAAPALKPHLVLIGYNVNDYESVANQADKLVFTSRGENRRGLHRIFPIVLVPRDRCCVANQPLRGQVVKTRQGGGAEPR